MTLFFYGLANIVLAFVFDVLKVMKTITADAYKIVSVDSVGHFIRTDAAGTFEGHIFVH